MHEREPQPLGHMIVYCGHLSKLCTDQRLRRAGYDVTPAQSQAMLYLSCCRAGQEVSQRDLEQELHLKPSTVNGIVGRLEEKGYIARRTSPFDGRIRLVGLTDAGRSKVADFRTALEETGDLFTAGLTGEEERLLRTLLTRIISNLENEVNSV